MDRRDQWTAANFGAHPALAASSGHIAGARTSIIEREDENGDLVLDVGGPSAAAPAGHHAANGHHPQGGEHHAGHQEAHAAKPAHAAKGPVPRPVDADFKPVHGKVPGPKNHVMCAVHGYVVDTATHQVIANSVDEYKTGGAAHPKHDHAGKGAGEHGHAGGEAADKGHGKAAELKAMPSSDSNRTEVFVALQFGMSVLRDNMKTFQVQVEGAAEDFASYAVQQLSGLKGTVKARDALSSIARIGAANVNQVLGGMGQDSAGLALTRKMADAVQKGLDGAASAAGAAGDNEAGLLAGVRALPAGAGSGCVGLVSEAVRVFQDVQDKVSDSLKAGAHANREIDAIVQTLMDKQSKTASDMLERYGVPGPGRSATMRKAMYDGMVRIFDGVKGQLAK